ncbi:MAG: DapH/DapD/GlmU-related protein [Oscillospiraceae bacterium]|nr:DapH/DapD/GlmU-related protein [Oscillospiraceae bacterium]
MIPVFDYSAATLLMALGYTPTNLQFQVFGVSDAQAPENDSLIFVKTEITSALIAGVKNCIFFAKENSGFDEGALNNSYVVYCASPKECYANALLHIAAQTPKAQITPKDGRFISADAIIGTGTVIEPFCYIGANVHIGANCRIGTGTKIKDNVIIGDNVTLGENCLIGIDDADVYRPANGSCKTVPHCGGVKIEDGCLLLAGAMVAAGSTCTTVIEKNSMVGMYGMVGHNCNVGAGTLIGGFANLGGHCHIAPNAYIGPKACLSNRIQVGEKGYVSIGSVVLKDVDAETSVFGNPARKCLR